MVAIDAAAAASPLDTAAALGQQFVGVLKGYPAAAAMATIEAQLALIVEQSKATVDVAVSAINIAEAVPGLSANARSALEDLKRLLGKRKNKIAALDEGSGGLENEGPGFAGGAGSDYR